MAKRRGPSPGYRFGAEIREWYERSASPTGGGLEFCVQVTLDLLGEIVDRSPVQSGRFRGNWRVGLGSSGTRREQVVAQGRGFSRALADKDGAATIRRGLLVLTALPQVPPTIFITNDAPYALRLERGYSKQAPGGIVALSVEAIGSRYSVTGVGLGQYVQTGRYRGRDLLRTGRAA